ncbi:MAG: Fe-S cluster assembly protein SufD [Acidobacteriota bacterium]|nr:Fe-S cluster assembly protein SufD [Acidobacteriota bacterium]
MTTAIATEKERYVEAFERLAASRAEHEPGKITELRRSAIARFEDLGFPTTRLEEWRFTNVAPIAKAAFDLSPSANGVKAGELADFRYDGTCELVLINGRFSPELSNLEGLPDGVVVSGLEAAWSSHPEKIEPHLGFATFGEHSFVALNTALHRDGAFLFIPRGVVVEQPINIIHLGRTDGKPFACFPRLLIVAEESSQSTVVEQYGSIGDGNYFTCPVTEVVVGANATVDHYKLQRESISAFHVATFQLLQHRDSNFSSHSISWGGGLVRNDVNAVLDGEGAEATLNGLYMVEGTQLVDNHMRVEHAQPNCDSHELFKGILEDRSRAVFNGRIYVHRGAQKTDAKQTNRNLLLSKNAVANSNPQLEIFADDVKCTHGSTVGQLDELGIFYLRSRGIGEEAARSLLTYAFAADIVERIKVPSVRQDLEEFLFRRLPKGDVVRQAV